MLTFVLQLEKMVAVAVQEKDASLTKKVCRERLAEVFGEARVEEHKAHIAAEVVRMVTEFRELEAEALASEASLASSLDEAREKLARYERVVKSERRAKMAAVEHAAKLAAAAEALADTVEGEGEGSRDDDAGLSDFDRVAARAAELGHELRVPVVAARVLAVVDLLLALLQPVRVCFFFRHKPRPAF